MSNTKTPNESATEMNELVLPNDTNILNNLMGGRLLHWMDICAAIASRKHCGRSVVTASVDSVSFKEPIRLGDVVTIKAKVTRSFRSSMEIHLEVYADNIQTGEKKKSNDAYYTFVAVDGYGSPIHVPELKPETEDEKKRYDGALRRRQLRMILAGKMKPEEATELRNLFLAD
ncbi:MAG: acyl-CoA thioesterase [Flavobacteriaceae bacterium]|nr:acyl-CoA thioesterase [Flavobacteriaceae bacterium]